METFAAIILATVIIILVLVGAAYYYHNYVGWVSFTRNDGELLNITPPSGNINDLRFKNCIFTIINTISEKVVFTSDVTPNLNAMAVGLQSNNPSYKTPTTLELAKNSKISQYSFSSDLPENILENCDGHLTGFYR